MSDARSNDQGKEADALVFPPFTRARRIRAELVGGILRGGRPLPDNAFDEIYPDAVRDASSSHWTSIRVCTRVVELLRLPADARLLDIGAGVGKFCIAAAAMGRARVRGVERHPQLAGIAREAARRLGVEVEIVDGCFSEEDPRQIDAAYLFNPFTERLVLPGLAPNIATNQFSSRRAADILAAEQFLVATRPGAKIVTFCGFGGRIPTEYDRLARETWDEGVLELWVKRSPRYDEEG